MTTNTWQLACPVPVSESDSRVTLAHGEGGRLTRQLIEETIVPRLGNPVLERLADAALLPEPAGQPVFTTDSFVVSPLFFPGGDIGTLAVNGTVNDLLVSGARPLWMSLSLIIEEGLPMPVLHRILESVASAAREADVQIGTGDTKVVPRDAADGLFVNTTGLGQLVSPAPSGSHTLRPGDELVATGPVGQHGIAVLAQREELGFEPPPRSDCAPLTAAVDTLREKAIPVRAMRDATRGGVAAVMHEWAAASQTTLTVDEPRLPVSAEVRGACELLGLDPLHVACEGTMLVAVEGGSGEAAVQCLRQSSGCPRAAVVGEVRDRRTAPVTVRRSLGSERPLDEPLGAPLPRIC